MTTRRLRPSWEKHSATQAQRFLVLISRPRTPDPAPKLTTSFTAFFGPSSTTLRPGFRSPRENASCNCGARWASVPGERGRAPRPAARARPTPTSRSVTSESSESESEPEGRGASISQRARPTAARGAGGPGPRGWNRAPLAAAPALSLYPHPAAPRVPDRSGAYHPRLPLNFVIGLPLPAAAPHFRFPVAIGTAPASDSARVAWDR